MEEMEDIVFLTSPIHKNKFSQGKMKTGVNDEGEDVFEKLDLDSETFSHMSGKLSFSIDGTIVGVSLSAVKDFLREPIVRKIRMGMLKMPKKYDITTEEDFFRLMAIFVDLEEA